MPISNLEFDLSSLGGSSTFTAATPGALEAEVNLLTAPATWIWDPVSCKLVSNNYTGPTPTITTNYLVDFVDTDANAVGFCTAGALDFTKFNEIDLIPYGGSGTVAITSAIDIVNAFAALTPSLTVTVVGCKLRIDNWNRAAPPVNIEVKKLATAGCVVNNVEVPSFNLAWGPVPDAPPHNPFETRLNSFASLVSGNAVTINWGDGGSNVVGPFFYGANHTYASAGTYNVTVNFTDSVAGGITSLSSWLTVNNAGDLSWLDASGNHSLKGYKLGSGPTFNTADCNNVLVDLSLNLGFDPNNIPGTGDLEAIITIGGVSTTIAIPAAPSISVTGLNIGAVTVPSTLPYTFEVRDISGNIITSTFSSNVYLT